MHKVTAAKFSMDALDHNAQGVRSEFPSFPEFDGFTAGEFWNGWGCPFFTKEQAAAVMEAHNFSMEFVRKTQVPMDYDPDEVPNDVTFDPELDAFVIPVPMETEPLYCLPTQVEFEGSVVKVWPLGSWYWTWVERGVHYGVEK